MKVFNHFKESTLDQWFGAAGQSVADDVLGRVTDSLGLPTLPPLSIVPPNTNGNNYVETRPAPSQPLAPEVNRPDNKKKFLAIAGIVGGVLLVVFLLKKRK